MMIKKIALSVLLAAGSSSMAFAATSPQCVQTAAPANDFFAQILTFFDKGSGSCNPATPPAQNGPTAAPEIDPASAISGLTLLVGGIAVVVASRRRQSQPASQV